MSKHIQDSKTALRRQMREVSIHPDERVAASARACSLIERQPVWAKARSILFYAPMAGELDIWPLMVRALDAGKTVCLPRFDTPSQQYGACQVQNLSRDVRTGQFGIREPAESCAVVPWDRLDLVLVPGMAFDARGHRLGRGQGFYDRLLMVAGGVKCGVAFDEQVIPEIPVEPHDAVMDCIVTPTRWIEG